MIRRGIAALLLLSVGAHLAACQKKPRVSHPEPEVTVVLPPEPEPSAVVDLSTPPPLPAVPAPLPPPPVPPPPQDLADADAYFAAAKFGAASLSYSMYLKEKTAVRNRDYALFRRAVSEALQGTTQRGTKVAEDALEELIAQYPASPYASEGRLLLALIRDNRKLRGESTAKDETIKSLQADLDRLKKIDMDRRVPPE